MVSRITQLFFKCLAEGDLPSVPVALTLLSSCHQAKSWLFSQASDPVASVVFNFVRAGNVLCVFSINAFSILSLHFNIMYCYYYLDYLFCFLGYIDDRFLYLCGIRPFRTAFCGREERYI